MLLSAATGIHNVQAMTSFAHNILHTSRDASIRRKWPLNLTEAFAVQLAIR